MGFVIVYFLTMLFDAVFLELSKNTLAGWIFAAAVFAVWALARGRQKSAGRWSAKRALLCFVLVVFLLGADYLLTAPPFRQVPAAEAGLFRKPAVTETARVAQGELTGVYNRERTARVYAGIPYAAPPVGDLRWREPQPAPAWEGVRACDTFAPMAMQKRDNVFYDSLTRILGYHDYRIRLDDNYREALSEDCLYLNIFAPAEAAEAPLPVLFFIHGGSLMTGQSYDLKYRGESLAARGLIVVNFAYRLGVFGYYADSELAAESPNGTTGDYGLLDQIAALSWVHENIAAFGGDPDNITIAGESAGASSVNALCVSPLTGGLFVRAIAESSGIVAKHPYHTFRTMEEALAMGRAIREEFGAADVADLRAVPAEKLVQTRYANSAMTVDGYAVAEMPWQTYAKGENHEQALLNGFNAKEADAFLLGTKATKENFVELLGDAFGDCAEEAAALVPAGSVTQDQKFIIDAGGEAKGSLNRLYSAAWFTWSHELWSGYVAAENRPVYAYYFTKKNNSLSNYHAGELVYAYGNLHRYPGLYDGEDEALSETMQRYWVNFAKTGDPNGDPNGDAGGDADGAADSPTGGAGGGRLPVWELRDQAHTRLLELGDTVRMTEDPYREIYAVLEKYQESLGE